MAKKEPVTIEGTYRVEGETRTALQRAHEPIFGPWSAIGAFAAFIAIRLLIVLVTRYGA